MGKTTVKQLRYLLALATHRHFRRAAESEGVTQPSLSLQIQLLEEQLGFQLVERRAGAVALTPLGREALQRAQLVLTELRAFEDLARCGGALAGTIRLGASPTLGPYILPRVVAALHREHRELRLYVREGLPRDLLAALAAGEHDIVLTQLPVVDTRLHEQRLFREPLRLGMAVDDPLAASETVEESQLRGRSLLTLSPQYRLFDQVQALAAAVGATVLRDYEGTSLDALRQMAGMGMGIALLPDLYVRQEVRDGDIAVRPVSGGRLYREIGLVWRRGAGASAAFEQIGAMLRSAAAG